MKTLAGTPFVPGLGCGVALTLAAARGAGARGIDTRPAADRLVDARHAAQRELTLALEGLAESPAREILQAHLALLADPVLTAEIEGGVLTGLGAEESLEQAASSLIRRFEALADPVLRSRAADIRDVCDGLARHLSHDARSMAPLQDRVICAEQLSPAQVLRLIEQRPRAVALETCVEASHAAILLRALGVPAVIGIPHLTELVTEDQWLVVDGTHGHVVVDPDPSTVSAGEQPPRVSMVDSDGEPARTIDGVTVAIPASVVDRDEAEAALRSGADGIGLFRTEWLFLKNGDVTSEQTQYEAYREIARLAGNHPITMRTIDLGGDKWPAGLPASVEPNPALGLRGIRLALTCPDLMKTQLRALRRAFHDRPMRLLLPMVNDADDLARFRDLLAETGFRGGDCEIGVMIETPAAALMADDLAASIEFLSIGTNDLTQYVLAADRESARMAPYYQPLHPAVLRLVQQVTVAAARHGRSVAACGAAASDPRASVVLVGLGIRELSVVPAAVPQIKRLIRHTSAQAARALADELIALPTAAAVYARLNHRLNTDAPSHVFATRDTR